MSRLERLCPRVRSSAPRPSYDSTSLSSVDTSTLSTTSSSDLWNVRAMPDVPFSRLSKPLSLRAGARQRPSHLDRFTFRYQPLHIPGIICSKFFHQYCQWILPLSSAFLLLLLTVKKRFFKSITGRKVNIDKSLSFQPDGRAVGENPCLPYQQGIDGSGKVNIIKIQIQMQIKDPVGNLSKSLIDHHTTRIL